jgi:hypothetical protein
MIEIYYFIIGFLVGIISIMTFLQLTWVELAKNIKKNFESDK